MKTFVGFPTALGFLLLCHFSSGVGDERQCPNDYNFIANICYKFHQTTVAWQAAQRTCEGDGAHLASVLNNEEYNGLLQHINANYAGTYWISGAAVADMWIWTSEGDKMNEEWWGRTPATSGRCAYFCSNTNKYWDSDCLVHKRFICEKYIVQNCTQLTADPEIFINQIDPRVSGGV